MLLVEGGIHKWEYKWNLEIYMNSNKNLNIKSEINFQTRIREMSVQHLLKYKFEKQNTKIHNYRVNLSSKNVYRLLITKKGT